MAAFNLVQGLVLLGNCREAHRPNCNEKEPHLHIGVTWSSNNWPVCSVAMLQRFLVMLRVGRLVKEDLMLAAERLVASGDVPDLGKLAKDYTASDRERFDLVLHDDGVRDPATLQSADVRVVMNAVFM